MLLKSLATLAPYSTKAITLSEPKPRAKAYYQTLTCWIRKKTSDEKEATLKHKGLKKRLSMKKEAILKCKGLREKSSDKKRGNLKTQGAKKKDP
jgi:hypothetical protein